MINIIPYDQNITSFIKFSFDYLNGKVNTFNRADLIIDWAPRYGSSMVAYHVLPNKVYVFPMIIARYCPSDIYFNFQIVDYLIHELTHIDQFIEFKRIIDENYNIAMEDAVVSEAMLWLKNNLSTLKRDLGIYTDESTNEYIDTNIKIANQHKIFPYIKRTYADHLWMLLDPVGDSTWDNTDTRQLINDAVNNGSSIILNFNDQQIIIQDSQGYRLSIEDLNNLFSDMYMGSTVLANAYTYISNGALYLSFQGQPRKVMCTLASKISR